MTSTPKRLYREHLETLQTSLASPPTGGPAGNYHTFEFLRVTQNEKGPTLAWEEHQYTCAMRGGCCSLSLRERCIPLANGKRKQGGELATHVQQRHRRIMVACLVVERNPGVDMQMVHLRSCCQRRAHKHVVQLLAVHIVQIRVPLRGCNPSDLVEILQPRFSQERFKRLCKGELVKVAGNNDLGGGVFG